MAGLELGSNTAVYGSLDNYAWEIQMCRLQKTYNVRMATFFLSTPFSRAYFSLKLTLQWSFVFLPLPMLALHEQCNKCVGHRVVVGVLQIEEPQIYRIACKVCVYRSYIKVCLGLCHYGLNS